ncbi:hypothetical protein E6O75_ATG02518 [Venturia nashicola]|uniref:Uncharacterized protein n=1 Tax=Venturia nashicola TaxID=86259 RepID=A0A4Z1P5A3_9PEZI|nr:hypothetical protein E6O75_ATG02518 [Venturia nashicola]
MFRATIAGTGHVLEPDNTGGPTTGELDTGHLLTAKALSEDMHPSISCPAKIRKQRNFSNIPALDLCPNGMIHASRRLKNNSLAWKVNCRNPDLPLLLAGVYFGRHALCIHVFALEQWRSTGGTSHAQTSPHHDYRIILRARAMSNTKIAIGVELMADS